MAVLILNSELQSNCSHFPRDRPKYFELRRWHLDIEFGRKFPEKRRALVYLLYILSTIFNSYAHTCIWMDTHIKEFTYIYSVYQYICMYGYIFIYASIHIYWSSSNELIRFANLIIIIMFNTYILYLEIHCHVVMLQLHINIAVCVFIYVCKYSKCYIEMQTDVCWARSNLSFNPNALEHMWFVSSNSEIK